MELKDDPQVSTDEILLVGTKYEIVNRLHLLFMQGPAGPPPDYRDFESDGVLRIVEEDNPESPPHSREKRSSGAESGVSASVSPAQVKTRVSTNAESRAPGPSLWNFVLTIGFTKAASKLDKKLQGRGLEARLELGDAPDTPHGDTIKPLSGERRGEWRYRIGDYRLIYRPNRDRREVLLIDVAPRGGAYT